MLIIGNWKMNGSPADVAALQAIAAAARVAAPVEVVVCPPYTMLAASSSVAGISVGAQDCHEEDAGAYTGSVSASMIAATGARYVLLGHSERRRQHGESDLLVCAKAATARRAGLIPVVCVGETATERSDGRALRAVEGQLEPLLRGPLDDLVIAYEPVWAIGSGTTPTLEDVAGMFAGVRRLLRGATAPAATVRLIYGGSVGGANAEAFFEAPGLDGLLIGAASLRPAEFGAIVQSARRRLARSDRA